MLTASWPIQRALLRFRTYPFGSFDPPRPGAAAATAGGAGSRRRRRRAWGLAPLTLRRGKKKNIPQSGRNTFLALKLVRPSESIYEGTGPAEKKKNSVPAPKRQSSAVFGVGSHGIDLDLVLGLKYVPPVSSLV